MTALPEFVTIVIVAGGLLGFIFLFDRIFGKDSFVALVGLIGLLAMALSLLGLLDLAPPSTGWWGN